MDIKIEGNPGTGNTFQEINIGTVQNYNPNATTVINYIGTSEERLKEMKPQAYRQHTSPSRHAPYVQRPL